MRVVYFERFGSMIAAARRLADADVDGAFSLNELLCVLQRDDLAIRSLIAEASERDLVSGLVANDPDSKSWYFYEGIELTPGSEYDVLSLRGESLMVLSDSGRPRRSLWADRGRPRFSLWDHFTVVDSEIPPFWISKQLSSGEQYQGPSVWAQTEWMGKRPRFYEELYELYPHLKKAEWLQD